jgi:hypothetical protein
LLRAAAACYKKLTFERGPTAADVESMRDLDE